MDLKTTPLHECHIDLNAKMGGFAGYDMPLYYDLGVKAEHLWTRQSAGLFDVSHMGQVILSGEGVVQYLERITPSAFAKKTDGRAQYSVLTNENGGMVDDLIITKLEQNRFFAVINAGCKDKDIEWMRTHLPADVEMDVITDRALIALQGPKSESVLRDVLNIDTSGQPYMTLIEAKTPCGADIFVSRLGYTGEDGFEISLPEDIAGKVWNALCGDERVNPVGLAARDSLRLDMGYPLYGHDIDDTTSPVEAGISWIIGKENNGFIGADKVLSHKQNGTDRRRAGVKLTGKGVAREGAEIRNRDDKIIGALTSGGFSPSLESSIGQGYINEDLKPGDDIFVNVRGRNIEAVIADMPFVPAQTKSMKKAA